MNKNIYRVILILSFITLNVFIIYGISAVLTYLKTGANRTTMLHTNLKSEEVYLPKVIWSSLKNPGRNISEQELKTLQDHYLKSWYIKNIANKTNNPYGIDDFYTENARVHLKHIIELNKKQHISIDATTLNHEPKLEFYSEDGQLAVITDNNVVEYQQIFKDDNLILSTSDTSSYKIILLLEDGFWRVRHKVRIKNQSNKNKIIASTFATIKNSDIIIENKPFKIKGINYYPQKTPWNMFGDDFNIQIINHDFQIIKKANLNCIRIFIPYIDFGKAKVSSDKLEKLKHVLDLAEKTNLKVIVTLFDFYGDYSILNWSLTHRHAEQIVNTFKNHKAILAWDLKNEPDLDFDTRNKITVLAWLSFISSEIKKFDPNHLITIGWSSPETAINLSNDVDFVSFHYYKHIDNFEIDYKILTEKVSDKPLVLQEFGLSSYSGIWNLFTGGKTKQAEYHKKMQAIFKKDSLAFLSWGLYDFEEIPSKVAGSYPWRKSNQKYFGFIDKNGQQKPAFLHITY